MRAQTVASRAALIGVAAVATALVLASVTSLAADVKPYVDRPQVNVEQVPTGGAEPIDTNTQCGTAAPDPVPNGTPIVAVIPPGPSFTAGKIPATWWRTPPYGDAGWQLHLRGFIWVNALAQRAYLGGQTESLNVLVEQVVAFHTQNPDPGTYTAATTSNANHWGWDEGTALRRLGAENCLYSLTKDARLIPGMQADVAVEYGTRFYGPPYTHIHNHGVMADLAVIRAADLLGRKDWLDKSISRLEAEAPTSFTPAGTSYEQSSSYHTVNVALWGWVADAIEDHRGVGDQDAKKVRALDTRAEGVSAWFTEPDGKLTIFGDSTPDPGSTRSKWTTRTFQDNHAGVVIGRWSWTDPKTTYYCIRYGPRRWAHGQQDRSGITWSTAGVRVLVNPGKAPYDPAGNYRAWATSAAAHNVATADRRSLDTGAPVYLMSTAQRTTRHAWTTVDLLYGLRHTRQYAIVQDARTLTVKDTYDKRATLRQFWHLDPSWMLASSSRDGKRLTFKSGTHILAVITTGSTTVQRGVTRPVAGWGFPTGSTRVAAVQIQVTAAGTASTTFRVDTSTRGTA